MQLQGSLVELLHSSEGVGLLPGLTLPLVCSWPWVAVEWLEHRGCLGLVAGQGVLEYARLRHGPVVSHLVLPWAWHVGLLLLAVQVEPFHRSTLQSRPVLHLVLPWAGRVALDDLRPLLLRPETEHLTPCPLLRKVLLWPWSCPTAPLVSLALPESALDHLGTASLPG